MGNILQITETNWKDNRDDVIRREGWFVPSLHIKFAQPQRERTNFLKRICSRWLSEKFAIRAEIGEVEVLEQEEIDKTLGLIGLKFTFHNSDGLEGDSVAFIDAAEVKQSV